MRGISPPVIANRGRRACSHAPFRLAAPPSKVPLPAASFPRETLPVRENLAMDQATHNKFVSVILTIEKEAEGLLDGLLVGSKA